MSVPEEKELECLCTLKKNRELPNWMGKKKKQKQKVSTWEREPKKTYHMIGCVSWDIHCIKLHAMLSFHLPKNLFILPLFESGVTGFVDYQRPRWIKWDLQLLGPAVNSLWEWDQLHSNLLSFSFLIFPTKRFFFLFFFFFFSWITKRLG